MNDLDHFLKHAWENRWSNISILSQPKKTTSLKILWDGVGGGKKAKNLSHIFFIHETWHSHTLPKEDPKNI